MKPMMTALVGSTLLDAAVTATQPDMMDPTSCIKSNLRVTSDFDPISLNIPIAARHVAEPTAERIVFMIVRAGRLPSSLP